MNLVDRQEDFASHMLGERHKPSRRDPEESVEAESARGESFPRTTRRSSGPVAAWERPTTCRIGAAGEVLYRSRPSRQGHAVAHSKTVTGGIRLSCTRSLRVDQS